MRIASIIVSILAIVSVLVMNALSPFGSNYQFFFGIVGLFFLLIGLVTWKSPKTKWTYILMGFLLVSGILTSIFQYRSEVLASYNEETWLKDREYQVYRVNNLLINKDIHGLKEEQVQEIFGKPEDITEKNDEKRLTYAYEGIWGMHQWTKFIHIYFNSEGKVYNHDFSVIDAVEDRENLKKPQY